MSSTGVQASCNNKLLQIIPGFKRKPINFLSCQQRSQDASHAVAYGANEQGRVHLPFKLWDVMPQHSGLFFFFSKYWRHIVKMGRLQAGKKACLQSVIHVSKEFHKECGPKCLVHVQRSHRGKWVHLNEKRPFHTIAAIKLLPVMLPVPVCCEGKLLLQHKWNTSWKALI